MLICAVCAHNNPEQVWFTVTSLLLEVSQEEVIVVDNSRRDRGVREMADELGVPCLQVGAPYTTASHAALLDQDLPPETVFLRLDSHVLLAPGSVEVVRDHFDRPEHRLDMLQGVLCTAAWEPQGVRMEPVWRDGTFGSWEGLQEPPGGLYSVELQGLGLFACTRAGWPGTHPDLVGWSGEEGYLHEKFRRHGGRTVVHPRIRWAHLFRKPGFGTYDWQDTFVNYLLMWDELGWDVRDVYEAYERMGVSAHVLDHIAAHLIATRSSTEC